ncbi:hypothetical protein CMP1-04 [Clavibacter phage CMP1]|uniref:Uncharacterized protein n=1 Tax=Clavibacter phage CMP1 TaxID=686439 RepID=D0U1Y8_9CAUD|nr:hypothetical protein CMP1-04 [Clavibacter phage CMP1]ACY35900.1 hypothetical protein CMP1-04 [Clavibacter phage CMP1]
MKRRYIDVTEKLKTADTEQGRAYRFLTKHDSWKWTSVPVEHLPGIVRDHDLDLVNVHLAGIHLAAGEVWEIPVLLRITGNGGKPGASRSWLFEGEPETPPMKPELAYDFIPDAEGNGLHFRYLDCLYCNYDQHYCLGCGEPLSHNGLEHNKTTNTWHEHKGCTD